MTYRSYPKGEEDKAPVKAPRLITERIMELQDRPLLGKLEEPSSKSETEKGLGDLDKALREVDELTKEATGYLREYPRDSPLPSHFQQVRRIGGYLEELARMREDFSARRETLQRQKAAYYPDPPKEPVKPPESPPLSPVPEKKIEKAYKDPGIGIKDLGGKKAFRAPSGHVSLEGESYEGRMEGRSEKFSVRYFPDLVDPSKPNDPSKPTRSGGYVLWTPQGSDEGKMYRYSGGPGNRTYSSVDPMGTYNASTGEFKLTDPSAYPSKPVVSTKADASPVPYTWSGSFRGNSVISHLNANGDVAVDTNIHTGESTYWKRTDKGWERVESVAPWFSRP
jgi:hypothetical protein